MLRSRMLFWILGCSVAITIFGVPLVRVIRPIRIDEPVWIMMWVFNAHLLAAVICMHAYERRRARWLMVLGMVACAIAFLAWSAQGWLIGSSLDVIRWTLPIATPMSALAIYAVFVGLLLMLRLSGPATWMRRVLYVIAAIAVVHVALAIAAHPFMEFKTPHETREYAQRHARWGAIYSIIIVWGGLACASAYYLRTLRAGSDAVVPPVPIKLTCPRCGLTQQRKTEGDACSQCKLRIKVAIP